tara:strand:+ start:4743 stop:4922 length:180 start_codon:yes stop_codon:yes gene_type:complete
MDHLIERIALLMEDEGYTVDYHLIEQMLLQASKKHLRKVGKLDLSQGKWEEGGLRFPEQ